MYKSNKHSLHLFDCINIRVIKCFDILFNWTDIYCFRQVRCISRNTATPSDIFYDSLNFIWSLLRSMLICTSFTSLLFSSSRLFYKKPWTERCKHVFFVSIWIDRLICAFAMKPRGLKIQPIDKQKLLDKVFLWLLVNEEKAWRNEMIRCAGNNCYFLFGTIFGNAFAFIFYTDTKTNCLDLNEHCTLWSCWQIRYTTNSHLYI
jgi:hypothetical protein